MMDTGITGKGAALHVTSDLDGQYITFTRDKTAKEWLTDPLRISDGRTVGEMNRDFLHQRLNEWIDSLVK